tara:strand:+ start:356 stop:1192 length:837 start_codon:yes stop_codon:yes gene_type:complete
MIIWLASYPKSGNTLLRSILASYFFSKDGNFNFNHLNFINQFPTISQFSQLGIDTSNEQEIFRNFIEAQKLMNKEEKSIKFLKTHSSLSKINNVNFTDFNNSLGAIYIVRDPRNVVTSFAHHYGLSIEQSTNIMINEKKWLSKTDITYKTFLGSWNINYNSWKQFKNNLLLIKYEDLVRKKKTTLIKIFKFIKILTNNSFEIDMVKLNKSIKSTEFQKLKKLEEEKVFTESMIDNATGKRRKFFRLGKDNNWKLHLDEKFTDIIERKFEKEMIELGYL